MEKGWYNFRQIEERWRSHWLESKTFQTTAPDGENLDSQKPKCYILDMFPYPSGAGLHIGHPKGYIASDIYSRYKRMQGFNVLHPMGFDSFGLPAEQYAIEHNVHPAIVTEQNIDIIRYQLQFLGLSYDWDRELATSRENYYQWTQWIFLQLFESWFDPEYQWTDAAGRTIWGKARPISELVAAFVSGERQLSEMDVKSAGCEPDAVWASLTTVQRAAVLNHYRLVYQKEVTVNWCPGLGTVLANEEVTNEGKSERGDFPVYQRPLKQWMMRITAYAERLLEDLDASLPDGRGGTFTLEWPEAVKLMQRNWIGRSEGADVVFEILKPGTEEIAATVTVFTTRPDTLFGATFMVLAPRHPLVTKGSPAYLVPDRWPEGTPEIWKGTNPSLGIEGAIAAYVAEAERNALTQQETKEKTGVFTGIMGRNPVNGEKIPVFVADYVSMEYGSGAIMAVPAHDTRDLEFARKYGLEVIQVVEPPAGEAWEGFTGDGISVNSPSMEAVRQGGGGACRAHPPHRCDSDSPFAITGLPTPEAKRKITEALESVGLGKGAVNYKLRDWIFSRQRYWGEPFPLASTPEGYSVPVEIPVLLPEMADFRPETSNDPNAPVQPPLGRADEAWQKIVINGMECQRELNVMPQWAGSCWYYLRFIDPTNDKAFCDAEKERHFMPVDLYIGGAEHAVLHLLYARFWHKALYDLGVVSTPEPFKKLFNQGMITADAFADHRGVYIDIREVEFRDGEPYHTKTGEHLQRFSGKMGKRYKNGLPPEEVGEEYGVDTLRLYEMYIGPLEVSAPWSMEGIKGMQRFMQRVWRNFITPERTANIGGKMTPALEKLLHKTILKVTEDIEELRFNTAIAALIELNNELVQLSAVPKELARVFLLLLAPFVPHIAEELWEMWGFGKAGIAYEAWPVANLAKAKDETVMMAVQVQGKMRDTITVAADATSDEIEAAAKASARVANALAGREIQRVLIVPGRVINFILRK